MTKTGDATTFEDLPFDAKYTAIDARDARFDGAFYTAVFTTGIYCRPSCPAPTPKRENVTFLRTAAEAQVRGFRPCLRCFPEALPGSPAWDPAATLAGRALALIDDGALDSGDDGVLAARAAVESPPTVPALASRLGVSVRTLNRALVEATGAPALAHARARRARGAFRLLASTELPVADVAFSAGFGSIRQFNDTIRAVFNRSPGELRTASRQAGGTTERVAAAPVALSARLPVRGGLDWAGLSSWFAARTVAGMDRIEDGHYERALALPNGRGLLRLGPDASGVLRARIALDDARDLPAAVATARRLTDADADLPGIESALSRTAWLTPLVGARPGTRIPGIPTLHEAVLRAVTGQQITVAAGQRLMAAAVRAARADSAPAGGGYDGGAPPSSSELRPFPSASAALASLGDWYRGPAARRATIERVLALLAENPAAPDADMLERLAVLKGVGPWTLAYTRLRALGDPDVDLSGDAALATNARALGLAESRADLAAELEATRPWRSYAAAHLWAAAPAPSPATAPGGAS
ncbi:bifunctional transcriptional activator/DNA repair enzyme AdaA [Zhihengliuella halotolerans]|uniref:DNA-3-methyladenine glycosylase II n=1 Tax=Zhihengliuella halotolerans TaxID=370736 RepID=A0A4Q8AGG6_9MICC|nr:Ada metal-binding domain-containing protein [Zhihengliuella halotolerans]RZU63398.1 DNA-3-methyladenine glycosylase II [Zhihengliuella halotolerans]